MDQDNLSKSNHRSLPVIRDKEKQWHAVLPLLAG